MYKEEQAIVSLTSDRTTNIPIKDAGKKNETMSDDSLFIDYRCRMLNGDLIAARLRSRTFA